METSTGDRDYMLACGIVWRKTADPTAGLELIEGLDSADPQVRALAQTLLVECGETSMNLLENAIAAGTVNPNSAGECMAEILRSQNRQEQIACDLTVN